MRILAFSLFTLAAVVVQLSIIEPYVNTAFYLNLPLLVVIFYNWFTPTQESILATLGIAWGISYFDGLLFGITILLFILTALAVQYISLTILTNRTIGSLIGAGIAGLGVYYALLFAVTATNIGLPFEQLQQYLLSGRALLTQLATSIALLIIFKLVTVRYEVSR